MSIRIIVIYSSLAAVLTSFVAFISGPLWGLQLDYEKGQQIQLLQIVAPIFFSYLATATTYAIYGAQFPEPRGERGKILKIITIGVFLIFTAGMILSTWMYYVSANGTLNFGRLDFERYTSIIAILLSLLGLTTSTVTMLIFAVRT